MPVNLKVPGIGRLELGSPIARERAGNGVGRIINVKGDNRPKGQLEMMVIGPDGKPKTAQQVMSRSARFWGNFRADDIILNQGSGLVTDIGVLAMANEYAWANPSAAVNTILALANWHASGTGATAAATTDKKIQTISTNGGQTPVAGTQSLVASGTAPIYQSVATIAYTGSEAVTEWGLHTSGTLSSTTGTPFTATTATSATVTGTPLTASSTTVAGQQFQAVFAGTTTVWGLVLTNTTSVLTIPAWYTNAADASGSTPGSTEAFTFRPVMWDHKVFSAVNVNNGDSIQYTYKVTIVSGG